MKKKQKKSSWFVGLGHLCLQITMIMLVWSFLFPLWEDKGLLLNFLFSMITGIGAIMLYIPLGIKLEEIRRKYGRKR